MAENLTGTVLSMDLENYVETLSLPAGVYPFKMTAWEAGKTKKENPRLVVTFEVQEAEGSFFPVKEYFNLPCPAFDEKTNNVFRSIVIKFYKAFGVTDFGAVDLNEMISDRAIGNINIGVSARGFNTIESFIQPVANIAGEAPKGGSVFDK